MSQFSLSSTPVSSHASAEKKFDWKIKLLFDSECPLCQREVRFIQRKDKGQGRIQFIDIADLSYAPEEHGGISYEEAMGRIHALLPNGQILKDVSVFREIYQIIGLGWVYGITRIKAIETAFNGIYQLWAKSRLVLTGRPPIQVILAERQTCRAQAEYQRCRLEADF